MLKKKSLIGSLTAALMLTSGISVALADTSLGDDSYETYGTAYVAYSVVVPGNNVNNAKGQTASQTKTSTGAQAGLQVNSTGGAALDVRTESSTSPNGSWKSVTSSNTYALDSPQTAGHSVYLQFSTGIFQGPVATTGNWRSN